MVLALPQRLAGTDIDLVRHDRAGGEQLGAADGYAGGVLVDDARDQVVGPGPLIPERLRPVALDVVDDIGQEQVVASCIVEIILQRPRPLWVVALEHLDGHDLAGEGGSDVVGGTAHEPAGLFRPGNQGVAAFDQFLIAAGQVPAAVDPPPAADVERHALDRVGLCLVFVQPGGGCDSVAVGRMRRHVIDTHSVQIDRAPVLQGTDMMGTGFHPGTGGVFGLGQATSRCGMTRRDAAAGNAAIKA
jgi:hypothetical protein